MPEDEPKKAIGDSELQGGIFSKPQGLSSFIPPDLSRR